MNAEEFSPNGFLCFCMFILCDALNDDDVWMDEERKTSIGRRLANIGRWGKKKGTEGGSTDKRYRMNQCCHFWKILVEKRVTAKNF